MKHIILYFDYFYALSMKVKLLSMLLIVLFVYVLYKKGTITEGITLKQRDNCKDQDVMKFSDNSHPCQTNKLCGGQLKNGRQTGGIDFCSIHKDGIHKKWKNEIKATQTFPKNV